MFGIFTQAAWSPYLAGAGIGILSCLALVLADRPLGMLDGICQGTGTDREDDQRRKDRKDGILPEHRPAGGLGLHDHPGDYHRRVPLIILSGTFHVVWVPLMWGSVFGDNAVIRVIAALAGGVLLGFGARWAGGCTSGHGISGSIQLSLASMITAACFFAGGITVAMLLYRVIGVMW